MTERWVLRRTGAERFVSQAAHLEPLLAKVLYARRYDSLEAARSFLDAEWQMGDPFALPDMPSAVERILAAVRIQEPIVVYGDYDADGVTATALLVLALQRLGARVTPYIPDRSSEAYGLNRPALARLREKGARLVVTVDCGIRSLSEVAFARDLGLDMIVTDHHSVPDVLPSAIAVVNPKRSDSTYPFRELAGVGVAYRLAQALMDSSDGMIGGGELAPDELLDLVAIGTVADIVPLLGENRVLVKAGLQRIRAAQRPGIRALVGVAGLRHEAIESGDLAYRLGPRLNGAGRLEHADLAYSLLVSESEETAAELAGRVDAINTARQTLLEAQVAMARADLADGSPLLLVANPEFHEGVVGLVASRLVETHYRPALVMRLGPDVARGSARSVPGFHITRALESASDLLTQFGGHEQAAGFILPSANVEQFRDRLMAYADAHLDAALLERRLVVDAIIRLDEVNEASTAALSALGPFGEGNPEPALASLGAEVIALRRVGRDGSHLRLSVRQGDRYADGIAFRQGDWADTYTVGQRVDVIYRPILREWQGEMFVQLHITAMRPHDARP